MSDRLPARLLVTALLRRVNDAGGMAMVRARGDADDGAILMIIAEKGEHGRAFERGMRERGDPPLVQVGPSQPDAAALADYWHRRRAADPDLWVIELDIAHAERFAAETIGFY